VTEAAPPREYPIPEFPNALRYRVRYGIAWRATPTDRPPWSAVYWQTQRWLAAGCFESLAQDLRALFRLAAGRKQDPTAATIEETVQKVVRCGGHRYDRAGNTNALRS